MNYQFEKQDSYALGKVLLELCCNLGERDAKKIWFKRLDENRVIPNSYWTSK